jgi:hypothetical protein
VQEHPSADLIHLTPLEKFTRKLSTKSHTVLTNLRIVEKLSRLMNQCRDDGGN